MSARAEAVSAPQATCARLALATSSGIASRVVGVISPTTWPLAGLMELNRVVMSAAVDIRKAYRACYPAERAGVEENQTVSGG